MAASPEFLALQQYAQQLQLADMSNRNATARDKRDKTALWNATQKGKPLRAGLPGQSVGKPAAGLDALAASLATLQAQNQGRLGLQQDANKAAMDRLGLQGQQQANLQGLANAAALERLQLQGQQQANLQGERLAAGSRDLAAQLANKLQLQQGDITGRKDLATLGSNLEEQRRKDAAARALALFRATPGKLNTLNTKAAMAELG